MAAVLKKRALAEFSSQSQTLVENDATASSSATTAASCKRLRLRAAPPSDTQPVVDDASQRTDACLEALRVARCSRDSLQAIATLHELPMHNMSDVSGVVRALVDIQRAEQEASVRCCLVRLIGRIAIGAVTPATSSSALSSPAVDSSSLPLSRASSTPRVQLLSSVVDQLTPLLRSERSQTCVAQCVSTLCSLAVAAADRRLSRHLVAVVSTTMTRHASTALSPAVPVSCLDLLARLTDASAAAAAPATATVSTDAGQHQLVVAVIADSAGGQDPRVRAAALNALLRLHGRGVLLSVRLYDVAVSAAGDDFDAVREAALCLLHVLSGVWPEQQVPANGRRGSASSSSSSPPHAGDAATTLRLADDAFAHICQAINDLSMRVRVRAAMLLGRMRAVGGDFLLQTLDKRLMSNLRRKRCGHERKRELVAGGEWASGRRWADDAPRELVAAADAAVVATGACGAFVHGLEDEFMEVRGASLASLAELAAGNDRLAEAGVDFVVDMFNDEIEAVRVRAIGALAQFGGRVRLRADQLDEVLAVLAVFSADTREALHAMLGELPLPDTASLRLCVERLLKSLARYPCDRRSVWRCLQRVGCVNASLVEPLTDWLLALHPSLQQPDADVHDASYVGLLVLVMNAAARRPAMHALFTDSVRRHFVYVRDTLPQLVPTVGGGSDRAASENRPEQEQEPATTRRSMQFVAACLQRADAALYSTRTAPVQDRPQPQHQHQQQQQHLLRGLAADLRRLAGIDAHVTAAAHCAADLLDARLLMCRLLASSGGGGSGAGGQTDMEALTAVLLRLRHQYSGGGRRLQATVEQLWLRLMCGRLLTQQQHQTAGASSSAEAAKIGELLAQQASRVQQLLASLPISPQDGVDPLAQMICGLLDGGGDLQRRVITCLLEHAVVRYAGIADALHDGLRRCSAVIYEPQTAASSSTVTAAGDDASVSSSSAVRRQFTAGLVLGLPLDAELSHVSDVSLVRVRVVYPDGRCHVNVPRAADFRQLSPPQPAALSAVRRQAGCPSSNSSVTKAEEFADESRRQPEDGGVDRAGRKRGDVDGGMYRLRSTVLIHHERTWSEDADVLVSLVLTTPLCWLASSSERDTDSVVPLCEPVRVAVHPRAVRRGSI